MLKESSLESITSQASELEDLVLEEMYFPITFMDPPLEKAKSRPLQIEREDLKAHQLKGNNS